MERAIVGEWDGWGGVSVELSVLLKAENCSKIDGGRREGRR